MHLLGSADEDDLYDRVIREVEDAKLTPSTEIAAMKRAFNGDCCDLAVGDDAFGEALKRLLIAQQR